MARLPRPTLGSAHALGLLALVLAAGGGYASAQSGSAPQPPAAYHAAIDHPRAIGSAAPTLITQLVVPADGRYAATAKLDVRRPAWSGGTGAVTCSLAAIGRPDRSTLALEPGEAGSIVLLAAGRPATPLSDIVVVS